MAESQSAQHDDDLERTARRLSGQRDALRSVLDALPDGLFVTLAEAAARIAAALERDGGVFFVGNGGSAAQAEHLATELVGCFERERRPLRAAALTAPGALLTALANDLPADELFVRPVRAAMRRGDVLVALSTSGRSSNVLRALDAAGELGCLRLSFVGPFAGEHAPRSDWLLSVPSTSVARVQEAHLLLGHALCHALESALCADAEVRPPLAS